MYIRSLFDANKNIRDPRQQRVWSAPSCRLAPMLMTIQQVLFAETEKLLQKWKHPDPYIPPTAPGGSKYERNIPAPDLPRECRISVMIESHIDALNSTTAGASKELMIDDVIGSQLLYIEREQQCKVRVIEQVARNPFPYLLVPRKQRNARAVEPIRNSDLRRPCCSGSINNV